MDFQFIELQHRQGLQKVMEVCGMSLEQAYDLYVSCDYNPDNAIMTKMGLLTESPLRANNNQRITHANISRSNSILNTSLDEDAMFYLYSEFIQHGLPFYKKYSIKFNGNMPQNTKNASKIKKSQPNIFKIMLQKLIQSKIDLNNESGPLSEGLLWSWNEQFPIGILVLDFNQQAKADLQIFTDRYFVRMLNQYFKIYGIISNEYQLQPWLKDYINLQQNANCLIVMRVSYIDEIEVIQKVKLSKDVATIKKMVKSAKSEAIQRHLDQSYVIKQHNQFRKGNHSYRRPKAIKEQLIIRQNHRLRQKQNEDFQKAIAINQEKNIIHNKMQLNSLQTNKPKITAETLKKMRQQNRNKLSIYHQGLSFKLRYPSGKTSVIWVKSEQKVKYLFDFVDSCNEEIGFQVDNPRNFDIIARFGQEDCKYLSQKKLQLLRDIFTGDEVLIIKQLIQ